MSTIENTELVPPKVLLDKVVEAVREDMDLWHIAGPDNAFKKGFDTAVRKYADLLGLLDTPLYEDWEDNA